MLDNYEISSGVIHQMKIEKIKYDYNYINVYNQNDYLKTQNLLNGLRIGFIKTISSMANFGPNSILDIGYGNGSFLKSCEGFIRDRYGYDISNIEPPEGVKKIEKITDYFDIVTFWDSLEHIEDLSFISNLNCKYIYITVPYNHYFDLDQNNRENWFMKEYKHRKPNEHLHHFSPEGLNNLMANLGYKILLTSNIEDIVRKPNPINKLQNTFTSCYTKLL